MEAAASLRRAAKLLVAKKQGLGHGVPSFTPPPSSRGLGRQVLILVTPVRIRLGVPTRRITNKINGYVSFRGKKKRHPLTLTSNGSTKSLDCPGRLPVSPRRLDQQPATSPQIAFDHHFLSPRHRLFRSLNSPRPTRKPLRQGRRRRCGSRGGIFPPSLKKFSKGGSVFVGERENSCVGFNDNRPVRHG